MAFYVDLKTHLEAGVALLCVESAEWQRFHADIQECCREIDKQLLFWNPLDGLRCLSEGNWEQVRSEYDLKDAMALIEFLSKDDAQYNKAVFVLEHFDHRFNDEDIARHFAVMARQLLDCGRSVIVLSPVLKIPDAVKPEAAMLDLPLPGREEIRRLLREVKEKHKLEAVDSAAEILDAVRGLGTTDIRNAFAKVAVDEKKITAEEIPLLIAEKKQVIRRSGCLDFVSPDCKLEMNSVGGLKKLKEWLERRKSAFGEKARKANLAAPKGILLLGIPGTGKSLCAKVVAQHWKMPLLRLDMGRIFGGVVGESEANMRQTIRVAEGLAPCVLWVDEIEKGLSGGASFSGERDGGTSVRVFGSLLTWMQEKTEDVFVFATANDIGRLPPELLRKGRFDEIFFVDLPGEKARRKIFDIHMKLKEQDADIVTDELIKKTEGYSGSEIEAIVGEALFRSYKEGESPRVRADDLKTAAEEMVPLSATMRDAIVNLREWAKDRCPLANGDEKSPEIRERNQRVRLRAEAHNPFSRVEEK